MRDSGDRGVVPARHEPQRRQVEINRATSLGPLGPSINKHSADPRRRRHLLS